MIMEFGIATVVSITVICYLLGVAVKASGINDKWIPVVVGFAGMVLGIVALYMGVPDFPATDPMTAAAVGIASGLASTGVHQAIKQFKSE